MTKLTLFLTLLFTLQSTTTSAAKSRLGGSSHIHTDESSISPDVVGSINDISELRRRLTLAIKNTSRNLMNDKQKAKLLLKQAQEESDNKKQTMKLAAAEQAEGSSKKDKTDSFVDLVMNGASKEDTNNNNNKDEVQVDTSSCNKWLQLPNGETNMKKFNNCVKVLQNEAAKSSGIAPVSTEEEEEDSTPTQQGKGEVDCEALDDKQAKKDCLKNGLLPSVTTTVEDSIEPQDIAQITPQSSAKKCFTNQIYQSITNDIQSIHSRISSNADKAHFLGGIVRLAAHDLLDFNQRRRNNPMGSDGCIDWNHAHNGGLDDIWCNNRNACPFKTIYDDKYKDMGISRADYWIAGANCVIDITSIGNSLGNALRTNFKWGRVDTDDCEGSGDRLPGSSGCDETERVLIQNMGLSWKETVALMGAHTLGSGGGRDVSLALCIVFVLTCCVLQLHSLLTSLTTFFILPLYFLY